MANVISELFKDIADSIRYKTGETGTMKPAEFPAEIMSIVTGGGSSGGESGGESGGGIVVSDKWIGESGLFTAEDNTYTIEHHLGKKPDIFLVKLNVANSALEGTAAATLVSMFITSDNLLGDATNIGSERLYYGTGFMYNPSKHIILSSTYSSGYESLKYPPIFATDTTIKFDTSGAFILSPNYSYAWGAYARTTTSSGGGGSSGESSDLVKHVTFIGEDGTQLYRMPVLKGDNCKDPVANGNIATPTKESTVDTVYTFSGWSLTQGGSANSAALSNVTEDRTVYVAFKASTRTYTVRFYDGDTLIKTQQIAYGGSSSYTYSKTDYDFMGWLPEPVNVTSDLDCYAQLVQNVFTVNFYDGDTLVNTEKIAIGGSSSYIYKKEDYHFVRWNPSPTNVTQNMNCYAELIEASNFSEMSWDKIVTLCENGLAEQYFSLGDTKTIHITHATDSNEDVDIDVQIVGFNADTLADGSGKACLSLVAVPLMVNNTFFPFFGFANADQIGGWSTSNLRKLLNNEFITTCLPADLRKHLKTVKKTTYENEIGFVETYDKVFKLAFINELSDNYGEQIYTYFNSADKRKKRLITGQTAEYVCRDKVKEISDDKYYLIPYNGSDDGNVIVNSTYSNFEYFAIGFCI